MTDAATISINGVPICGCVGAGASLLIPVDDIWARYVRHLEREADGPLSPLRDAAYWTLNGRPIAVPQSYFVEIRA